MALLQAVSPNIYSFSAVAFTNTSIVPLAGSGHLVIEDYNESCKSSTGGNINMGRHGIGGFSALFSVWHRAITWCQARLYNLSMEAQVH